MLTLVQKVIMGTHVKSGSEKEVKSLWIDLHAEVKEQKRSMFLTQVPMITIRPLVEQVFSVHQCE